MIAVGRVRERSLLVDDADGRFMGADVDALDLLGRTPHLVQKPV